MSKSNFALRDINRGFACDFFFIVQTVCELKIYGIVNFANQEYPYFSDVVFWERAAIFIDQFYFYKTNVLKGGLYRKETESAIFE